MCGLLFSALSPLAPKSMQSIVNSQTLRRGERSPHQVCLGLSSLGGLVFFFLSCNNSFAHKKVRAYTHYIKQAHRGKTGTQSVRRVSHGARPGVECTVSQSVRLVGQTASSRRIAGATFGPKSTYREGSMS